MSATPGRLPWKQLRNVLAIRLDNIGDVVMLTPALRSLRDAMPKSRLTLLATKAGTKTVPMLPWINDVITTRPIWQDISGGTPFDPEREHQLIERLREPKFDAAVIFTSFTQSPHPPAYLCRAAGIPVRIAQSSEAGPSVTHFVEPRGDDAHQTDRSLHLLESLGLRIRRRDLELRIPAGADVTATHLLEEAGLDPDAPFCVLAPGASCPTRRYHPLRFAAAIRLLRRRTGIPVILVGSEAEHALSAQVLNAAGEPIHRSLAGRCDVTVMSALIRRADLLIANNSGPMHIADALRTPMVILYSGSERLEQWRPRSSPAALLRRPVTCSPCHAFECPFDLECLDIAPGLVVAEAEKLLAAH